MTSASGSILVILAHPDDESFGMGGTLAKYAAEGAAVTLICATRGEAGIPGLAPEEAAQVRERELMEAAQCLGLAEVRFLDCRDGEIDRANAKRLVEMLRGALVELSPDVVITFGPDGISGHPDHVAISRLVTLSFDRAGLPAALFYLAPSEATAQASGLPSPRDRLPGPQASIEVRKYLVTKVRAMQCYASQHPSFLGNPEEEAERLTCHEYFRIARPTDQVCDVDDLFAV